MFKAPLETLAVAGAKGVWDAVFILLVIWPALLLYQIMNQSGGYTDGADIRLRTEGLTNLVTKLRD